MDSSVVGMAAVFITFVMFLAMYLNIRNPAIYKVFSTAVFVGIIVGMVWGLHTLHSMANIQ